MKQQPVLTNFPQHVFATARRRFQARIRHLRRSLAAESFSGYSILFSDVLPGSFLEEIDPTLRQRHFGHLPVFRAWLAQILEGNSSCSKALGFIQSWSRSQGLPVPSRDTSSYCKARLKFSPEFLARIGLRVDAILNRRPRDSDRWRGFTLKAIDGTSVKLSDTESNQDIFPQLSTQKQGCGFPVMGIAGLLNLGHGGWECKLPSP